MSTPRSSSSFRRGGDFDRRREYCDCPPYAALTNDAAELGTGADSLFGGQVPIADRTSGSTGTGLSAAEPLPPAA